jgi:hypothetical protein
MPIYAHIPQDEITKPGGENSHYKNSGPQLPEHFSAISMKYE